MSKRFVGLLFVLLLLLVAGCRRADVVETPPAGGEVTRPGTVTASVTATIPPASATPVPATDTPAVRPSPTALSVPPTWPTPEEAAGITAAEIAAATALAQAAAPDRDDVALAESYQGVLLSLATPEGTAAPLSPGTRETLNVLNFFENTNSEIEAELLAVSERAYFWFDTNPQAPQPDRARLPEVQAEFDRIFEAVTVVFGEVALPGDGRVHILHASPVALCGVPLGCGLGGYMSFADTLPRAVNPNSNERVMFVMNAQQFGGPSYLSILAHEFRHLVAYSYDVSEADWETEGSAVLAEELAGWPLGAYATGNAFLVDPDAQLNHWPENDRYRHYGQGYVLSRYLYHQLGPELYRALAMQPANGLGAVDALAAERNLDLSGERMWLEWLVALAVHNRPGVPERYQLGAPQMNAAGMTGIVELPFAAETSVSQYGADYFRLTGSGTVTVTFSGSELVPLLDTTPPSGRGFWYAGRASFAESRLTRALDLRGLSAATLEYQVYHDIETGFDFAYVAVSTDGGRTWQPLAAPGMQSRASGADPSGTALAEHFYTGRSGRWMQEQVDLTPYAGQEILLRFSYVTDPVTTHRGLALDNIAVLELGFYDDGEGSAAGWTAEGFTAATAYLPQVWHVQFVTFPAGGLSVTAPPLGSDNTLRYTVSLDAAGGELIVIVAATAPDTLEPAEYRLEIEGRLGD